MSNKIRFIYFAVWFLVILILHFVMGVLASLLMFIWCAALYLMLATPVRTLRLSAFALLFFTGLILVSHLTLLFQVIFANLFLPPLWSNDGKFLHVVFLAPISEEIAKLVSVGMLLVIWKITGGRITFGAIDMMLCGLGIGIGLNLFESMLIGTSRAPDPGWMTNLLVPTTELQITRGRPDIVFVGHSISTAFIGLALGWSRYLPKLVRYIPVLAVWVWMIWCHALYNGQDLFDRGNIVFFTAPLTWITPWVFLFAVLATIAFEGVVLHYRMTDVEKTYRQRLWQSLRSGLAVQRISQSLRDHTMLRQLAYARVWLRANPNDRNKSEKYLANLVANLETSMPSPTV